MEVEVDGDGMGEINQQIEWLLFFSVEDTLSNYSNWGTRGADCYNSNYYLGFAVMMMKLMLNPLGPNSNTRRLHYYSYSTTCPLPIPG